MRKILLILTLAIICGLIASCTYKKEHEAMDRAQAIVDENPDSALRILRKLSKSSRLRGEAKARFFMLLTEARYKADSLPLNDSLIRLSVDYYELHQDAPNAARARYLAGITDESNQKIGSATINFLRADKLARQEGCDTFLLGLINRSLGDIFTTFYDTKTSLGFHKKANEYFRIVKASIYADYELISLSNLSMDLRDYANAINYADSAERNAIERNDSNILFLARTAKASVFLKQHEYEKARQIYLKVSRNNPNFSEQDYMNEGLIYLWLGDTTSAMECNRHLTTTEPGINPILINHFINQKRYKETIDLMTQTYDIIDSVTHTVWTRNDIALINDYYNGEEKVSEIKIASLKTRNGILIITFILLAGLSISIYFIHVTRTKHNLMEKILEANDLKLEIEKFKESLAEKSVEIESLEESLSQLNDHKERIERSLTVAKRDTREAQSNISRMREQATHLISSHFSLLNSLLVEYYSCRDTKAEKEKLYQKVKEALDSFICNPEMIAEIEEIVNTNLDNLILKLREDFPKMRAGNIHLYTYSVVNLSPAAIALLLDTTLDTLYTRKSKLKSKISDSNSPNKALYLQFLD